MDTALLNWCILAKFTLCKPNDCPCVITLGLVEQESLVSNGVHVLARCVECAAIILFHQWAQRMSIVECCAYIGITISLVYCIRNSFVCPTIRLCALQHQW
jgi:hypothetical protein